MKLSKSIIFVAESFLGNFCGHLAIFSGHTDHRFSKNGHGKKKQLSGSKLFDCEKYIPLNESPSSTNTGEGESIFFK